jgi:hypothetical protein
MLFLIMLQQSSNGMLPQQQQAHAVQDGFDQVPVVNGMNSLHLSEGQERARATVLPVSIFSMFCTHKNRRNICSRVCVCGKNVKEHFNQRGV